MHLVGAGDGNAISPRRPYPTDVSDGEWAFVASYLRLMAEDTPLQREGDRHPGRLRGPLLPRQGQEGATVGLTSSDHLS